MEVRKADYARTITVQGALQDTSLLVQRFLGHDAKSDGVRLTRPSGGALPGEADDRYSTGLWLHPRRQTDLPV